MVRRDAAGREDACASTPPTARCTSPAGESPASVSAGAPSSRPQASGGDPCVRAGRQEPLRREQVRGPQHQVKPAASTEEQSGSRAAHVTAKAMSAASVPERGAGSSGVRGAARVQGGVRNTRDPSRWPSSGQGVSYKPKAKSAAAERESEGIVVPQTGARAPGTNAVKNNAAGGKGPCGGQVGGGGKREGMAGKTGPNDPRGRPAADQVRQLRRRLWVAAKRSPTRRFHALYDRIYRDDVLWEAWRRVRRNRGSAGLDAQSIAAVAGTQPG